MQLSRFTEVYIIWASQHTWEANTVTESAPSPSIGLWLVQHGGVELVCSGQRFCMTAGDAILFPPHTSRQTCTPEGATWFSVGLVSNLIGGLDPLHMLELPCQWRPSPELFTTLSQNAQLLATEIAQRDHLTALIRAGLGRVLLGWLWRSLQEELPELSQRCALPDWLLHLIQLCHQHPDLSITELAGQTGYSTAQFRRLFHQWMGMSPHEYQHRHRMDLAKILLLSTDLSVTAIGEKLGYESLAHFSRLFKQSIGLPPVAYRRLTPSQL